MVAFLETVSHPKMHRSIEEEELTAQRDAAVSLFKGLQEKVGWVSVLIAKKRMKKCGETQCSTSF